MELDDEVVVTGGLEERVLDLDHAGGLVGGSEERVLDLDHAGGLVGGSEERRALARMRSTRHCPSTKIS
jgi:hypothetical protein